MKSLMSKRCSCLSSLNRYIDIAMQLTHSVVCDSINLTSFLLTYVEFDRILTSLYLSTAACACSYQSLPGALQSRIFFSCFLIFDIHLFCLQFIYRVEARPAVNVRIFHQLSVHDSMHIAILDFPVTFTRVVLCFSITSSENEGELLHQEEWQPHRLLAFSGILARCTPSLLRT